MTDTIPTTHPLDHRAAFRLLTATFDRSPSPSEVQAVTVVLDALSREAEALIGLVSDVELAQLARALRLTAGLHEVMTVTPPPAPCGALIKLGDRIRSCQLDLHPGARHAVMVDHEPVRWGDTDPRAVGF